MYAYEYAIQHFQYSYNGNYNGIYLFNDNKPKKYEEKVKEIQSDVGIYIPVEFSDDTPNVVVPYGSKESDQNLLEKFFSRFNDDEMPESYDLAVGEYLIKHGYMIDEKIEKELYLGSEINSELRPLYSIGNVKYIKSFTIPIHIPVGLITSSTTYIKPYSDFDDKIDKSNTQLIIMISDDGAKLEKAYQSVNEVNTNEIVLFVEEKTGANTFGSVIRVKTGSEITQLDRTQKIAIKHLLREMNLNLKETHVVETLRKHIKNKSKNKGYIYYAKRKFKKAAESIVGILLDLSTGAITKISHGILNVIEKYLKIPENRWRYTLKNGKKNPNYNPFLPIDWLLEHAEKSDEKTKERIGKLMEPIENKIEQVKNTILNSLNGYENEIVKQFQRFLTEAFKSFDRLKAYIGKFFLKNMFLTTDALIFFNGLVVGVINSILDTIALILHILNFFIDPKTNKNRAKNFINTPNSVASYFMETIENGIDIFKKLFSRENLIKIISIQFKIYTLLFKVVTLQNLNIQVPSNATKLINADRLGYIVGFIIGFVIEEMVTLGTASIKVALVSIKETVQALGKAAQGVGTRLNTAIKNGEAKLADLFKTLKSFDFGKFLDEIYKWLDNFINEAIKVFKKAYDDLFTASQQKRLEKVGITPTKYNEVGKTFTFCPIKTL